MKTVGRVTIAAKIYGVVGFLAIVAGVTGWLGVDAMQRYEEKVGSMQRASGRAIHGERVNGLINSVVMDSRGIYMARDRAEAEKYGKPLLAGLKAIEKEMAAWAALLPEARRHELDGAAENVANFIKYRTELVRL